MTIWSLLCATLSGPLWASSPEEVLQEAAREYRDALECEDRVQRLAMFARAELLFSRLANGPSGSFDASIANAELQTNIGNAALGAERLGSAILAYRRALVLDPDHRRAAENLRHARSLLPDWVPRPEESGLFDTLFSWGRGLSQSELNLLASIAFLIFAACIACSIRWRQTVWRGLAVIPAGIWLLLLLVVYRVSDANHDVAVVIVPEVIARSADSTGAPARIPQPLPGGTELNVLEKRDEWVHVRLFDNRYAWIPASSIEFVGRRPPPG